jgi:hypothetical protein
VFARLTAPPGVPLFSPPAVLIAALLASAQFGLIVPPVSHADRAVAEARTAETVRNAVYLLPVWPTRSSRPEAEHVKWAAVGPAAIGGVVGRPVKTDRPKGHRVAPVPTLEEAPLALPDSFEGSKVFIEPEVEHPVARDPASDGPRYPEYLRSRGIEGWVVIRFIVDTLGHADSGSLRVVETSQGAFADAVRFALPRMKFVPAEAYGRHVPQLVMQEFRFILSHPDSTPAPYRPSRHG